MKIRMFTGLSAIALCVAAGGVYQVEAIAGARSAKLEAVTAQQHADNARRAIAGHDAAAAVQSAELAVGLSPRDASYRALLGQAYLLAGRFESARTALTDSLSLAPGDGKAALNLALAQIAQGDWAGARSTLDSNSGTIALSDRGLAMALAGDPAGAVDLMLPVARQPGSDAKLRQNLALSLALAGRWQDAKLVASLDLSPTDVDRRMTEWATFARPTAKSDQVAALLHVTPAADPGQPVALALNAVPATAATIDSYVPAAPAAKEVGSAAADTGVAAPAAATEPTPVVAIAAIASPAPGVVFGPRREVVQSLPPRPTPGAPLIKAPKGSYVQPVIATKSTPGAKTASVGAGIGKGDFYVQLGAYDNAGVARDGWARASRAFSGFSGHAPQGVNFSVGGKNFYRLSVGGFDRAGAVKVCQAYRAKGGKCFVRAGAGDTAAEWTKKTGKVAQKAPAKSVKTAQKAGKPVKTAAVKPSKPAKTAAARPVKKVAGPVKAVTAKPVKSTAQAVKKTPAKG